MRNAVIVNLPIKKEHNIFLASDLHGDDTDFNSALFFADMDKALDADATIFLGGDAFSMIIPSDRKRFTGSRAAVKDGIAVDAYVNNGVEKMARRLAPYANNIAAVGVGNHEATTVKYNGVDLTRLLIYELNKIRNPELPPIQQMGYKGFLHIKVEHSPGHNDIYKIWYDHGRGGSSVITKGMIDMSRALMAVEDADLFWMQHKHVKWVDAGINRYTTDKNGNVVLKKIIALITGTYQKPLVIDDYEKTSGYISHYGEEKMTSAPGTGGAMLLLRMNNGVRREFKAEVRL